MPAASRWRAGPPTCRARRPRWWWTRPRRWRRGGGSSTPSPGRSTRQRGFAPAAATPPRPAARPTPRHLPPPPGAGRGDGGGRGMTAEPTHEVVLTVNGVARTARVPARRLLSDLLRHDLRLTGTHVGCEHGVCGACTVLVDGEPVRSCLTFA